MTTYEAEVVELDGDYVDFLEDRGLGDGLPVVAPTPERVEAMLTHAAGDPDEVLFTLQPRAGIVTRRVVAINAVLAGCRPEVFPVVLTALRALAQPEVNIRGVNATTHIVAPMILVHGEIARTAGFNGGVGCFGPGNRANATVGRAVRLVMLHVAGAKPGFGDAATHGQPAKYTFCAAENLDESPWEGYARSRGVNAPSAVTVHCGEGPHNVHDAEAAGDPALILDKIASAMTSLGMNNAPISQAEFFIILGPEHAASLAQRAMTRKDVSSYLFDHARIPHHVFKRHFEERAWTQWMKIVADDHLLPMTAEPDNIRVVVAGGPGKHSLVVPSWGMTRSVTLPVEG
ncbi:MAG: hypothetical protein JWO68_2356 [Actinomycetia bacterium]|nr:hypothetical protein [Actinomycetes bacterium]